MTMFKSVDVWERTESGRIVRYRCFESLASGKFSVQSADFYTAQRAHIHDEQFVQLLAEQEPSERAGQYETLAAAIAAHKRDFNNER